jgi:hypothetical protein
LIRARKSDRATDYGWFVLDSLDEGPDLLVVRAIGYRVKRVPLTLGPADTLEFEVRLDSRLQVLPELSVTGRGQPLSAVASEAARRVYGNGGRASGLITRREIERWGKYDLSSVYRRAGLTVQGDDVICPWRAGSGSRPGEPLAMMVYVDGMRFSEENRLNVRAIPPDWVEVIEVYPSIASRPVEFNMTGATGCLLLIWTRR